MGIFVNYLSNIFSAVTNNHQTIVTADSNVIWATSIIICNRGAAPIRFNLQKSRLQGLTVEKTCYLASVTNLVSTYNNGISGVGATLTNSGAFTTFSIDGLSPPLNSRILIKDQTTTFQNGIYVLSNIGSTSSSWILTRALDFDSVLDIQNGDAVSVSAGNININTNWIQNSNVTSIGTSPITFINNAPSNIYYINEFEIAPYKTVDIINITGVLNLDYSINPYVSDKLVCFSNGYTQIFDCEVVYAELNELPTL